MSFDFKRVCVSGGAGFIGSKLVCELIQRGMEVVVIDNLSVGSRENVHPNATLIEGDILDLDIASKAASCDVVFHLAARVAIRSSFKFVTEDTMTNVIGTVNLLRAVTTSESSVRKFLFTSSMAVYADAEYPEPVRENHMLEPLSPYGVSKLAGEMLVKQLCAESNIESGILRLFNTYGTGQAFSPYVGVVTIFAKKMLEGNVPSIFGDGRQCRDFVHVEDVVQALIKAMDDSRDGSVYNIGSGNGLTVNDVYQQISNALDFSEEAQYVERASGEMRYSIANIDKAVQELGYKPLHTFNTAIIDVLNEIKRGLL